ncbi:MAG: DUF2073 domain-containing protein [Candidatus Woesearchaeota archaeon]
MVTLQYMPHKEIQGLDSDGRINKILKVVKTNKIVLLEGRLKSEEEASLIRKTMEQIDEDFTGVELVTSPELNPTWISKVKSKIVSMLLGNRYGFTIIGPAKIIKEIKQDPSKIQLFAEDAPKKNKKR